MKARFFLSFPKKTIVLPSLFFCALLGKAQDKPVNIVLINLDDVGCGDFSCTNAVGYETPHIDQMAANGMRFSRFLACQPISGASRAGLLTGCYPNRIGFSGAPGPNSSYGIHEDEMTMGELVKQKGYATAVFGKWHLGDAYSFLPLQNGFDEYYGLPYSNDMWPYHPQQGSVFDFPDLPTLEGNQIVGYNTDQTKFTGDYTRRSVQFIKKNKDRPFFLYLAHSMAHVPLAVSEKFEGKSAQGLYGDVMMELDWSVGQVMKTLGDLHLLERTLVILLSDNGPWTNYGNHAGSAAGLREAKAVTFDGGNRIPCIFYWKGVLPAGSVVNKLATNLDVFPTVAELVKVPLPKQKIDGVSLMPFLKGDLTANPRKDFVYYFHKNDLEAVTDGLYKLVFPHEYTSYTLYPPGEDGKPGKLGKLRIDTLELYDLRRDPGERYNVVRENPKIVEKLKKVAEAYRKELGDDLRGVKGMNLRSHGRVER